MGFFDFLTRRYREGDAQVREAIERLWEWISYLHSAVEKSIEALQLSQKSALDIAAIRGEIEALKQRAERVEQAFGTGAGKQASARPPEPSIRASRQASGQTGSLWDYLTPTQRRLLHKAADLGEFGYADLAAAMGLSENRVRDVVSRLQRDRRWFESVEEKGRRRLRLSQLAREEISKHLLG